MVYIRVACFSMRPDNLRIVQDEIQEETIISFVSTRYVAPMVNDGAGVWTTLRAEKSNLGKPFTSVERTAVQAAALSLLILRRSLSAVFTLACPLRC
jgi:hypothetical protein